MTVSRKKLNKKSNRRLDWISLSLQTSPLPSTIVAAATENAVASPPRKTIEAVIHARIETARQKKSDAPLQRGKYHAETRRPLLCLVFIFPLILVYEVGTILLGSQGYRSGVDQWLDRLLSSIGFGQLVLLPVIATAILIAWHHRQHDHWRIRPRDLSGMLLESVGLGLMLYWAANALRLFTIAEPMELPANVALTPETWWPTTIALLGSGIYEELFFRLMLLLPVIYWATKRTAPSQAKMIGMVFVSLLFASLHYNLLNPSGSEFEWSSFFFRFAASIVFCVLFLFRGFGIAVGTHVAFDVLTQL